MYFKSHIRADKVGHLLLILQNMQKSDCYYLTVYKQTRIFIILSEKKVILFLDCNYKPPNNNGEIFRFEKL